MDQLQKSIGLSVKIPDVLCKATYADARAKLHHAEYSSDLTDTEGGSRKRKASAKLLSQLSSQSESSENSDSGELPPTPPDQLLGPAAKKITSRVTSHTAQQVARPTAQRVARTTAQQFNSPTIQPVSRPTAQQFDSPTVQRIASPTVQRVASPTCEAMFSKVLTILEEVKETQCVHGKMLNALLKKQDNSVVEVPEGVVFPLKTQANIEALEEKLGDLSLMSAIVSVVTDIGGTSVDDATRRMMKYVLSNELAMEYNMFGRHGKKKFKDTFSTLCMNPVSAICQYCQVYHHSETVDLLGFGRQGAPFCGILKMQTNNVVRVLFKDCKKYVFSPTPFTFKTFLECVAKKLDLPTMDVKVLDVSKTEIDEEAFEYLLSKPDLGVLEIYIPGTASLNGKLFYWLIKFCVYSQQYSLICIC
ncbi:hypothetical protein DPEC_G00282680 [Dallia pectoralis]|uniref:Uncharacterized protein n=1 Tax=Dallia pectoralis TaxID=75939 RepID=A0ACC2FIY8_DALPE|nr:hypothetical protein DPEC_G00282680 [Dallia pectoralis]